MARDPRSKPAPFAELPAERTARLLEHILALAAFGFGARYMYWRARYTDTPEAHWFFVLFLVTELLGFVSTTLFLALTWRRCLYAVQPPLAGRSVDVLITTYNEPVDLLRDTVACATRIRYPHRTLILDDGARPEVAALAEEFGCVYLGRVDRSNAKAGNLNNGLRHSEAEFLVTLDADHVPTPELIDELIGFFANDRVGIVQANQDCYNLDSFQHEVNWRRRVGWQMQELFFNVVQPGKDAVNATIYCGSPAMLRRSALDDIGGFAVGTITEDLHTGMRMQKRRWRVVYFNRSVARGLAPQTFVGYAAQWHRWGIGSTQVLRIEQPLFGRGFTLAQRVAYLASYEYNIVFSYVRLVSILTVVFASLTGVFPLHAQPFDFAEHYLPYLFANLAASSVLSGNARTPFLMERYNFVKIYSSLSALSGYFQEEAHFQVTPKSRAPAADLRQGWLYVALLFAIYTATVWGIVQAWETREIGRFWAYVVTACFGMYYFAIASPGVARIFERIELRSTYRFPRALDTEVAFDIQRLALDGSVGVYGRTFARNLNRNGLSVTLEELIPVGTFVSIRLEVPGRQVTAFGQVAWTEAFRAQGNVRHASGIRFLLSGVEDGDAIMRHLFWNVAPRHGQLLTITSQRQSPVSAGVTGTDAIIGGTSSNRVGAGTVS